MRFFRAALFVFCLFPISSFSQQDKLPEIPPNYFLNPLDLKLFLSGTFGEIRTNHFHSGIDIKTNQREGYPVYAVADGYISRLRVQIGGFGNAVYINHPNGLTSVYAHLQRFNSKISLAIKNYQYLRESFEADFPLTPIEIPVKKGDIIAWSGNTGGSAGPHLHFEIRNTKTEQTINPLALGIKIQDDVKPQINGFYIYKINHAPFNEFTPKQYFQTIGTNGKYTLNKVSVVNVSGKIGFGLVTHDLMNGSGNRNGIYSTTIWLDNEKIYETQADQFYFDQTRAVNAYIDYPSKISSGRVIEKGFISKGGKNSFHKTLVNNGIIYLQDNNIHDVKYLVKDANGNEAVLNFKIKSIDTNLPSPYKARGTLFNHEQENTFIKEDIAIKFLKGTFYDDVDFTYSKSAKTSNSLSPIHIIHNKLTPLHQAFELLLKVDSSLNKMKDKLVIVNENGIYQGGELTNGYIRAYPKSFGKYYLKVDSIAPNVTPINIVDHANLSLQKAISFKIGDNLSGIKEFKGYINGKWILMEYDYKRGLLWHNFDERTGFGKHTFTLVVSDMKKNTKTIQLNFFR
ncbi:M23 family metallopeptidase [Pedobacter glucosidilyticus]|uniref:M23 family metallopeptidase n=1 Tax=Pedobacter glucosidilyticus TaxID=1122941 RepID=UPI00041BF114|nr:M23 family metallopeptidase [Pedobacter glucosidilyticus]